MVKTILKFGNTNSINQFKKIFSLREIVPNKISFLAKLDEENHFGNYVEENKFKNSFQYINEDLDDLGNFSYDLNYTYFMSYCGWFQFFLNKWDRASMSNSIEIRMPFLDKEVRLFNLSIPQNIKYRNGYTKSILRDSFKEKFCSKR